MEHWKAHYKDQFHNLNISILNTQGEYKTDPLSFEIDGIVFEGASIGDFQLADPFQYEIAKQKFNILKYGGYDETLKRNFKYNYCLQGYQLDVEIPVKLVRKCDMKMVQGVIKIDFEFIPHDLSKNQCIIKCDSERVYRDDEVVNRFSLVVDEKIFECGKPTLCFENALRDISDKIKEEYYLKCCFTCQYSDYSPYGNDDFGIMLCYRGFKEECLKVNDKDDWFEFLEDKNFEGRQETYLCEEYSPRNKASGYRGFVNGID